jgi:hypothetical protein
VYAAAAAGAVYGWQESQTCLVIKEGVQNTKTRLYDDEVSFRTLVHKTKLLSLRNTFFILFSLNNSVSQICRGCLQLLIWEQALAIYVMHTAFPGFRVCMCVCVSASHD